MNNHYELLYLTSPAHTEEELEPIRQKVRDAINKVEGNITFEDNFGKKKLAYPIEKNQQGYYLLTEFDLDGKNLEILSKDLKLTNDILRHIIVKRKSAKQTNRLRISDEPTTESRISGKPERKTETTKDNQQTTKKEDEPKVSLEELDERLDEILEGDIM